MADQATLEEFEAESVEEKQESANTLEELKAFNLIVSAVGKLSANSRKRVVGSALTFLGYGRAPSDRVVAQDSESRSDVGHGKSDGFSEDRTMSPKEFMLDKRPRTDVERIVTLAYYLTHYRATPHFKTLDLSKLNTEAAQTKFSNAAKSVDNAAAAGLLVPAGKGQKQISAIGELYVQALPDREAARAAIAHARRKRKTRRPVHQSG